MTFSDVVEVIKELSTEEKQEIQSLLSQYLREERREQIADRYRSAQIEQQEGDLKFSSDLDELKRWIKK